MNKIRTMRTRKAEAVQAAVPAVVQAADLEVAQAARVVAALEVTVIQNRTPPVEAGPTATSRAKRRRKRERKESSML